MGSQPVKVTLKKVRPLLSTTSIDAKRRVLNLFKQWCRESEYIHSEYDLQMTPSEVIKAIKNEFLKNKDIKDIRVIDMLVIKGENELHDVARKLKFNCQLYYKYSQTYTPPEAEKKPDFMSKFLRGLD